MSLHQQSKKHLWSTIEAEILIRISFNIEWKNIPQNMKQKSSMKTKMLANLRLK